MSLFIRNPEASHYRVTLNGEEVPGWVFASEELGVIAVQRFPEGWQVGDAMPPEAHLAGNVRIERVKG